MRHLRCICFVRPSPDTIQHLIDEFREPKYGEYAICEYVSVVSLEECMINKDRLHKCHSQIIAGKTRRSGQQ